MPSPFPGMDPYIEAPELWSDFHTNLASEIQSQLNQQVQPGYFARLTPYVTYEVVEIGKTRGIRPDVTVSQPQPPLPSGGVVGTATITPPPVTSMVALEFPLRLYEVEVRSAVDEKLVTLIEILSPVNKRPGHEAFEDYQRKRREIMRLRAVHLLEIDLLRGGQRPPLVEPVPDAPYYVVLGRADMRPMVEVWPIQLQDRLPVLPVPLLEPDPDVPLDLGGALDTVYDRAAYALQIDYTQPPPPPPLPKADAVWLEGWLKRKT